MDSSAQSPVNLKHRLTGAAVLVVIAVVVIPWLLGGANGPMKGRPAVSPALQPKSEFVSDLSLPRTGVVINSPASESVQEAAVPSAGGENAPSDVVPTLSATEAEVSGNPLSEAVEAGKAGWIVQLGVFKNMANAVTQQQRLQENGIRSDRESMTFEDKPAWRIVLGPFDSKEEADRESGKAVLVTGERALVLLIDRKS